MHAFAAFASERHGLDLSSWSALYKWSIQTPNLFWGAVADFTKIAWQRSPTSDVYLEPPSGMMRGARWFPGARLNFAQNLMPRPGLQEVIISHAEGSRRRFLCASELREQVAACQASLRSAGVTKGDRVCGVLANTPEAVVAMLATASLGAVWASCSPDFGEQAIIDRFSQIAPKVMFATKNYMYGGKYFDCTEKIRICADRLASVNPLRKVVWVDHISGVGRKPLEVASEAWWSDWINPSNMCGQPDPLTFESCAFEDPLYILFSSGTTGVPKCIVHSVGGTLLQHKKEILLHSNLGQPGIAEFDSESRLLFFTTCGWMMWNWMASALACGTTIVLYEGSPIASEAKALWRIVESERVTAFGLSPKYVTTCKAAGLHPKKEFGLSRLKWILSTGAPLLPDYFEWLYAEVGKNLHIASISGGTDIISCFMLGNPMAPVHVGEIQGPGLGMAIECWDANGRPVREGRGELVCTKPFVAMPVGFWNDPSGQKYGKAYFEHFQRGGSGGREIWRHGDYVEFTGNGGIIVHGRSDATLNPAGVRIGTAEIYRVVERHEGVLDSVAVGIDRGEGEEVVLLVKIVPEIVWDKSFEERLRQVIRKELSPRHVPAAIVPVVDIPYTRSGKKMELAVGQTLRGEVLENISSIANPASIDAVAGVRTKIFVRKK